MTKYINILKGDFKNVFRDKMYIFILLAPVLMGFAFKIIILFLETILLEELAFHLFPYYLLITSFVIIIIPLVSGMLFAFLILEDRDQGIITYLSITPFSKKRYLLYRLSISYLISFISVLFAFYYLHLIEIKFIYLLPVLMMTSLGGPLIVLLISTFADNKVEGFAFAKGVSIFYFIPLAAYFIDSNIEYIFAIFPSFWIYRILEVVDQGDNLYFLYTLLGFLCYFIYICLLMKKFQKRYN
ncbi:MAG: hypothetical protein ACQEQH_03450 [Bacillota bacterium]